MDKVVTLERVFQLGVVGNLLITQTEAERAVTKAQAHANFSHPLEFTHNGYTVKLIGQPREKGGLLEVYLDQVSQNGKPVFIDPHMLFQNPPIMVADGTIYKKFDPNLNQSVELDNYKEDIGIAFQDIVVETIRVLHSKQQ